MRKPGLMGAATVAAIVIAGAPAEAQRVVRGSAGVPQMTLNAPAATMPAPLPPPPPGGWGPGGWQGGPRPTPGAMAPFPPAPPLGAPPPLAAAPRNVPQPLPPLAEARPIAPVQPVMRSPGGPRPGGWQGQAPRPGNWNAPRPGNWGDPGVYSRPFRGGRLSSFYVAPRFYVPNWSFYGLGAPGYGQNWVRYYDDAVLIDRDGAVLDARYGMGWDRYDRGRVPEYVGSGDFRDDRDEYDRDRRGPLPPYHGGSYGNGVRVIHVAPGSTVVIHTAPSVVTTTTTTYYETVSSKAWRPKAHKVWKPKPKCACR